jgi:beta-glucuronidase
VPRAALIALALVPALAAPARAQEPAPPAAAPPASGVSEPSRAVLYRDGHGGRRLLDGTWHFRADPERRGLAQGWQRAASLEGWTPVEVPHSWNAGDLSDASQRGGLAWYRKDFRLPRARRGVRWVVRFESVNYRAAVWLNGRRIGGHEGAYVPFELPADGLSRTGGNRLVVRASSRRTNKDVPPAREQSNGRPGGGWWNDGGLLREVYLRPVDGVDIDELLARPDLPCRTCDATVLLRATLRNFGRAPRRVRVTGRVEALRARFAPVTVPGRGTREVSATVRVRHPRLWEIGDGELYRVEVDARMGRRTVSRYRTHVGIRSLRVDRRGSMLLNGRPVALRGAAMHEDVPGVGAALGPEHRRHNFALLQALGATATRSHYPLHPHTLEMADRAGVLVWDEIPFTREGFAFSGGDQLKADAALRLRTVRAKGLGFLEAMIRRDQNHASVFAWSIGNEFESRPGPAQQRYIRAAVRTAKRLDPTRLSALAIAGYPQLPAFPVYRELDALGYNLYFGWYVGTAGGLTERDRLAPFLDQLHRYYPRQALFVAEFGAEANRPGPIDEKGSFAFQSDLLQYHLDVYDQKPFLNGALVWILRDFRVQPGWKGGNPKPDPPWNHKGLVNRYGEPKPAFGEVARRFSDVDPVR